MKAIYCLLLSFGISLTSQAQSIIGNWQLVKQSNCMEEKVNVSNDTLQNMVNDMKSMSSPSPQIVSFKEKLMGEETTRILGKKKSSNSKTFMYKFDGELLMILDKKSQTITDNYLVEKFSSDSLIISNVSKPCETKIFLRIK